jgi:hypothetical protein
MSRFLAVCFLPLFVYAQNTTKEDIKPYEDSEAYNVYAAVLALKRAKGEVLIADTTVAFNDCMETRSDEPVDAAIENYKKINQVRWRLGYHFESTGLYKLLTAEEAKALLPPHKSTGEWPLSPEHGIHRFSAVGFNSDKTIAFVETDVICGTLCGHGSPYILQKKKGKWVEYSPPTTENPDGTITMHSQSICGWYY